MVAVLIGGRFNGKIISVQDDLLTLRMPVWHPNTLRPYIIYYEHREFRNHSLSRDVFAEASMSQDEAQEAFLSTFYGPGY